MISSRLLKIPTVTLYCTALTGTFKKQRLVTLLTKIKIRVNDITHSNKKRNIESESQRSVVKIHGKNKKSLNRAVFSVSAKHVTRKRELNNKLKKLICNTNTT